MDECADLEIKLHREGADGDYTVEMRSATPDSEVVSFLGDGKATIEPSEFARIAAEHPGDTMRNPYGDALTAALFGDENVLKKFIAARAEAQGRGSPLRVRLFMATDDLHDIRWELLRDPSNPDAVLALSSDVLLSRHPVSKDRKRVGLRRKSELRALVAVANRPDIGPVNVTAEVQRVTRALGTITSDVLPAERGNTFERATLTNILARLRDGHHDILYLVAHGGIRNGVARIWLDTDGGGGADDFVEAVKLTNRIAELPVRPRLVVLGSCESAAADHVRNADDDGRDVALAFGPALARVGIPAVIAMQGEIDVTTLEKFTTEFFKQLTADGVIDRAVMEARNAVVERSDWWSPALFMRLTNGRIWSTGFGDNGTTEDAWTSLVKAVRSGMCTVVLGPNLMAPILGSREDLSRHLATEYHYPLSASDLGVLHRVEQYVETRVGRATLGVDRRKELRRVLLERFDAAIPDDLRAKDSWNPNQMRVAISAATDAHLRESPDDPYRRLARLRSPIYIDTSTHDGIEHALRIEAEGDRTFDVEPVVRVCPWYDGPFDKEIHFFDDEPTESRPLVYHLFGRASIPTSVVIGEDRLYDYLFALGRESLQVPDAVPSALVSTSLLFIGFRLDDPEFRAVFRYIQTRAGSATFRDHRHAAVQLEPSEDVVTDVRLARDYYERYLTGQQLIPYWGTAAEFLTELVERIGDDG